MATAQTVPHVVEQSKPAVVVPITKRSTETVSQTELALILSLRGRLHQLESKALSSRFESGLSKAPPSRKAITAPNSKSTSAETSRGRKSYFAWLSG